MDLLGKSPVPLPILILGKFSLAGCWVFFGLQLVDGNQPLPGSPLAGWAGIFLVAAGLVLAALGLVSLGRSTVVGIPERATELKTRGVYRISRNPVYFGAYLTCIGSCLFSFHPLNVLSCAAAITIHHWIVREEEKFLERRFGQVWLEYRSRVRRYLGRVR